MGTNRGPSPSNGPFSDRYNQLDKRSIIGTEVPRLDAVAKVTGAATYTHDVILDNMLHAVLLRSPYASAQVVSMDVGPAEAMVGVRAIVSYPDKRVRYAGEEVAAVAAETLQIARDAVEAIRVNYEVYPAVVTLEDAMADSAPQVFDGQDNAGSANVRSEGDVEAGFEEAAAIVERSYRTPIQTHSPMETHSVVCQWVGADELKVWQSTQGTFSCRDEYAEYFGLPHENVQVICEYIGGGFGSKIGAGLYGVICAEMARESGRPVKLIVDRKGEQLNTGNRPDSVQLLKVGARADGSLCAIDLSGYGTPGVAYGAGFGTAARDLYTCENIRTSEVSVATHCGPATTMRAPGHPQGVFSLEGALDDLAWQLGMDPVELRLMNDDYDMRRQQFQIGADRFGWSERNPVPGSSVGPVKRGTGVASCTWWGGGFGGSEVRVTIRDDGDVHIENGVQDIGTGTRTWIVMLVAEELGLAVEDVRISIGDTHLPYGTFSGASTTTPSMSAASREAGEFARLALAELVADQLGAQPEELLFADGLITAPSGESMSFAQACSQLTEPLVRVGTRMDNAKWGKDITFGVQYAEVDVDTRTGKVTVNRITAVHDAGRILNKLTADSQVIGGVIGGLNYALFEERVMDRNLGLMMNANLEAYKIGGSRDMPSIEPVLMDVATGGNYVGALGLGEPPFIPTAAAIANAVSDAIGVRITQLPITPARVLEALGTIEAPAEGGV